MLLGAVEELAQPVEAGVEVDQGTDEVGQPHHGDAQHGEQGDGGEHLGQGELSARDQIGGEGGQGHQQRGAQHQALVDGIEPEHPSQHPQLLLALVAGGPGEEGAEPVLAHQPQLLDVLRQDAVALVLLALELLLLLVHAPHHPGGDEQQQGEHCKADQAGAAHLPHQQGDGAEQLQQHGERHGGVRKNPSNVPHVPVDQVLHPATGPVVEALAAQLHHLGEQGLGQQAADGHVHLERQLQRVLRQHAGGEHGGEQGQGQQQLVAGVSAGAKLGHAVVEQPGAGQGGQHAKQLQQGKQADTAAILAPDKGGDGPGTHRLGGGEREEGVGTAIAPVFRQQGIEIVEVDLGLGQPLALQRAGPVIEEAAQPAGRYFRMIQWVSLLFCAASRGRGGSWAALDIVVLLWARARRDQRSRFMRMSRSRICSPSTRRPLCSYSLVIQARLLPSPLRVSRL